MSVATLSAKKTPAIAKNNEGLLSAKGIEAFFAGKQTDSMGRTKQWTDDELDEIAQSYNDSLSGGHEAPVVLGHSGSTAKGWIAKAYRDGKILKLDYKDVLPEFAAGVNRREHPKRSISIYPRNHPNNPTPGKLNIKHIAYLPVAGEIQPAVKGLADHKFNEQEDTYEYSELASIDFMGMGPFYGSGLQAIAQIFQSQREQMIEDVGVEEADKVYGRDLLDAIARDAAAGFVSFEQFNNMMTGFQQQLDDLRIKFYKLSEEKDDYSERNMEITLEQFNELKEQLSALETQSAAKDERIAALEATNQQQAIAMEQARVAAFCEGLVRDRKLLPNDKNATIQELLWLSNENSVEFSEGGQTVSKTPRQAKMDRLAAGRELWSNSKLPVGPEDSPNNFSDQSLDGDFDAESVVRDRQIRAKAAEMFSRSPSAHFNANEYAEAMTALGFDY